MQKKNKENSKSSENSAKSTKSGSVHQQKNKQTLKPEIFHLNRVFLQSFREIWKNSEM